MLPIDIKKEPGDMEYRRLIQYAFEVCETFVFSMQREMLIYYPEPEILTNSYLVQSLVKNIQGNPRVLYDFLESFKLSYGRKE